MTYRPGVMAPGFPLLREDEIINFEPPFPTRRSAISTAVRERPGSSIASLVAAVVVMAAFFPTRSSA